VPIVITSLSAPAQNRPRVHSWGGLVFHDVIGVRHAKKAIEAGVDGLDPRLRRGRGGCRDPFSFALMEECAKFGKGPIAPPPGAIGDGAWCSRPRARWAPISPMSAPFHRSEEANADPRYKQMIAASDAADILYSAISLACLAIISAKA